MTPDDLRTGLAWSRLARGRRARALRTLLEAVGTPSRVRALSPAEAARISGEAEDVVAPLAGAGPRRDGRRPAAATGLRRARPLLHRRGVSGTCARDHRSAASPFRARRRSPGGPRHRHRRSAPRVARGARGRAVSSGATSPGPASASSRASRAGWTPPPTRRPRGRRSDDRGLRLRRRRLLSPRAARPSREPSLGRHRALGVSDGRRAGAVALPRAQPADRGPVEDRVRRRGGREERLAHHRALRRGLRARRRRRARIRSSPRSREERTRS